MSRWVIPSCVPCPTCGAVVGQGCHYINHPLKSIMAHLARRRAAERQTVIDMAGCPRVLTKEQMIEGLQRGRTLAVDRVDAPELADLQELERQGLVTSELVMHDEQSSALKFRWKK